MSATAPNQPGASLEETIDYASIDDTGPKQRPNMSPQGPHRYLYGSGARPLDGYTIKRAVGRGGFGEVYYATSDSGKEVALKLIMRNVDVERRGVAQCMNLKCPNLLMIHDIRTNDAGETFVVMEYVAGPSLSNVLAKHPNGLPEHEVRAWIKGLVEGVDYLHDHGIVHRDLKPANLFMEEGIVKIGDYGLSKMISPQQGSEHSESIGTCHYMAPEISNGKYGKPIDIYAIGVIIFELLTGRVPFDGESVGEVLMKHLTARPDLSPLAEPWRSIVAKAISKVPTDRQARAIDLLPTDSAAKPRDVRFIGEGKVMPPTDPAQNPNNGHAALKDVGGKVRVKHDDVLRITEEEPPFYIGPNTRPPVLPVRGRRGRPGQSIVPPIQWLGGVARSKQVGQLVTWGQRTGVAMGRRAVAAMNPTPTPPPLPVPLPTPRVRTAELTGSMVSTAMLTGLVCLPIAGSGAVDLQGRPQDLAFLFLMTMVGSWGILAVNKVLEGRKADPVLKRLIYLVVGLALGLFGVGLAGWIFPTLTPSGPVFEMHGDGVNVRFAKLEMPMLGSFLTYFGLAGFANGWWKLTDRDRPSRLRLWPIAKAGVVGLLVSPLWPYQELWSAGIITMTAVVLQLASPWSEPAATYARYVRKQEARGIKVA